MVKGTSHHSVCNVESGRESIRYECIGAEVGHDAIRRIHIRQEAYLSIEKCSHARTHSCTEHK